MRKYIHIGYPKNFSTSLQRNYFGEHPDFYHLGIGLGSNLGYIDDLTSSIFEVYLKSAKAFKYTEQYDKLKNHIHEHYLKAKELNKKCFGVSSEHLSFSFTHDSQDFNTKIARAVDLFGADDLHFIVIIRNQADVIKSLYRESVRVGFPGEFGDYLYNLYKFQDRNYYYDFRYDLVFESLSKFVPQECLHFLFFENYRSDDKNMVTNNGKVQLINDLSASLDVDYHNVDFVHYNEALNDTEISIKARLNSIDRHDLGREMSFAAEIHRQKDYFSNDLGIHEPEEIIYQDVLTKRANIEKAKIEASKQEYQKLNYNCDQAIAKKVLDFYQNGNLNFANATGKSLPPQYIDMKF